MPDQSFLTVQEDRANKANAAFCLALEMLAYVYHAWENGEPCFAITDGEVHTDDPLGNAFRLFDEEDSIIKMLDQFFPTQNVRDIDPKTWDDRIDALSAG